MKKIKKSKAKDDKTKVTFRAPLKDIAYLRKAEENISKICRHAIKAKIVELKGKKGKA